MEFFISFNSHQLPVWNILVVIIPVPILDKVLPIPSAYSLSLQRLKEDQLARLVLDYSRDVIILRKCSSSQHPVAHTFSPEKYQVASLRRMKQLLVTDLSYFPEALIR